MNANAQTRSQENKADSSSRRARHFKVSHTSDDSGNVYYYNHSKTTPPLYHTGMVYVHMTLENNPNEEKAAMPAGY